MSRPFGSKNKKTLEKLAMIPKKRGRPVGSKKTFIQYIDEVAKLSKPASITNTPVNYDEIKILNCTGHDVNIRGIGTITPHSYLRVSENAFVKGFISGIPVFDVNYATGLLPPKTENTIYVVGQPVCLSAPDRNDLYLPHKVNHINKSCEGLVQNPFYKDREKVKAEAKVKR